MRKFIQMAVLVNGGLDHAGTELFDTAEDALADLRGFVEDGETQAGFDEPYTMDDFAVVPYEDAEPGEVFMDRAGVFFHVESVRAVPDGFPVFVLAEHGYPRRMRTVTGDLLAGLYTRMETAG